MERVIDVDLIEMGVLRRVGVVVVCVCVFLCAVDFVCVFVCGELVV